MLNKTQQEDLFNLIIIVAIVTIVLPYIVEMITNMFLTKNEIKKIEKTNIKELSIFHAVFKIISNIKNVPIPSVVNNTIIVSISFVLLNYLKANKENNLNEIEQNQNQNQNQN